MKKFTFMAILLIFTGIASGQNWLLTGNANTATTSFIGTTDARDFRIRTSNSIRMIVDASGKVTINNSAVIQGLTIGYGGGTVNTNTAYGASALLANTSGSSNLAAGFRALTGNTTGSNNTAVGSLALAGPNTGSTNTAVGYSSLNSNTSGFSNVAVGSQALERNTSGNSNTALGKGAILSNTTGSENSAYGSSALASNSFGSYNVAAGSSSLSFNSSGSYNCGNGYRALYLNTTGKGNTSSGAFSLYRNSTGNYNTAIGDSAMFFNTTGNNNTTLGYFANVSTTGLSNATAIGSNAIVDASNKMRLGNSLVSSIGGQVAWTNFSDGRIKTNIKNNVPGLNFIKLLNPVTYNYDITKQYELQGSKEIPGKEEKSDIENIAFSGFIAQEVDEAARKIGYDFSGVDKSGNIMGLRYSEFVVPVVKAIQELSAENEELKKENELLKQRLDRIEKMMISASGNNTSGIPNQQSGSLEQNIPNPAKGSTTIGYTLPKNNIGAAINIYSQNGGLVKTFRLKGEGRNTITLQSNELSAGTYNYVLMINGKQAESRQMVIQ